MRGFRFNLFLLVLIAAIVALGWGLQRDLSQPNYESMIEGQMARTPAYTSFAPNPNFPDGMTLRQPPEGTIIRGQQPLHYQASLEDAIRAGQKLKNPFAATDERAQLRGSVVFANFCQLCHGTFGLGAGPVTIGGFPPPPSLMSDRSLQMPDGQMFHILTYGQGNMPSIAAQLSPEDRWCAILYVRQLQHTQVPSGRPVPVTLQGVVELFRQNCSACHGDDGTGNVIRKALPNIPDFTNLTWQVAQTEMAIVNQIDYGSQPLMPAFRYKLTRDQIQGLAVYVRSFPGRQGKAPGPAPVSAQVSPVEVWQTYCFACHETTGQGNSLMKKSMPEIPDFTSSAWQKSRTDGDLGHSILEGKGKFMLPMKDKLGPVNVKEMVALVRAFEGGKQTIPIAAPKLPGPPPPEKLTGPIILPKPPPKGATVAPPTPLVAPSTELAARIRTGASLFQQFCIVCHGPDGTGSLMRASMPAIPDFTDRAWHERNEDAQLLVSILDGKGTLMPANSGRITREQAQDLLAYIRAFGPRTMVKAPATDSEFDRSFRQLQQQWDELERELQKIRPHP
jgi:mono/diheme cytochrome c family protein